jgi:hypothetical protein
MKICTTYYSDNQRKKVDLQGRPSKSSSYMSQGQF